MFPSADLAQQLSGNRVDLRREGSGNPGATNVDKLLGRKFGAAVLIADVTKGLFAAAIGRNVAGAIGANVAGTAAVLGHCYPVLLRRRGGKGVATRYGQLAITDPRFLPIDLLIAIGVGKATRRGALAVGAAVISSVVANLARYRGTRTPTWLGPVSRSTLVAESVSGAVVLVRFAQESGRPDELRRTP